MTRDRIMRISHLMTNKSVQLEIDYSDSSLLLRDYNIKYRMRRKEAQFLLPKYAR